ncbi:MAG TPA: NAD(P)-binding domain-containing protein [Rhizomicrobium sp.]|nr:NAD(P)-binding domain-containing protein [Rhizomicrobium sp.]
MTIVDFEEAEMARPALRQPAPAGARVGAHTQTDNATTDVAIIGAGPYGLSLAAQLAAQGASFRIFGKPLDTWRHHMPKDMRLKSDGFATSLSHPSKESTLKAYCAERNIEYADMGLPIPLDLFLEYGAWFRKTYVPALEEQNVTALEKTTTGFALTLEDGRRVTARRVVLAIGITSFKNLPDELGDLAPGSVSHSFDHRDGARFAGKDVVVLGAGASAIDLAALLHDAGAKVKIVARDTALRYHTAPGGGDASVWNRLRNPPSTIGPGWRSFICMKFPYLFRFLPERFRLAVVKRHLGPASGWFMRQRIEGHVERLLGHTLDAARMMGDKVLLRLTDARGEARTIACDHVAAATGYRPDLRRVPFMSEYLLSRIATTGSAPKLSGRFETTVPGLYVIGPASANSFGPLMRFMTGAEYAAPVLAKHLARKA